MNLINKEAPNFEFLLHDGEACQFHGINSQQRLLIFYDSASKHCADRMLDVQKYLGHFQSDQLTLVGIDINQDKQAMVDFTNDYHWSGNWVHGYDDRLDRINFRHYYYMPNNPTMILVSQENCILAKSDCPELLLKVIAESDKVPVSRGEDKRTGTPGRAK